MTKVCSGCQAVLPATAEFFHRQKKGKHGLTSKCKVCKNVQIEAWRQRNPERHAAYRVKWKTENRESYLSLMRRNMHQRRGLKKGGSYSITEWRDLCDLHDNRCLACGSDGPLTVDHVIPLIAGGSNTIDNIQPLCRSCNSRKGTKTIDYRTAA